MVIPVLGVICEYNPFHNGHASHLAKAREQANARWVICVMSGPFVQRGDVAIVDKWTRARCALEGGADLVLELPTVYACRPARDFARGAVGLLAALGCVTHLGFGSEIPLDAIEQSVNEPPEHSHDIKRALKHGQSYPRAVASSGENAAFTQPNATLGVEYLRAIRDTAPGMMPVVIPRVQSHDACELSPVTSASAIRVALKSGLPADIAMPPHASVLLNDAIKRQGGLADMESIFRLLIARLRSCAKGELDGLPGAGEGLGNRLMASAAKAENLAELFIGAKCKRYTMARIRRVAAAALINPSVDIMDEIAPYARVLGFRKEGRELLGIIDKKASIPMITKVPVRDIPPCLSVDIRAQELWALACPKIMAKGMDYTRPIVIV